MIYFGNTPVPWGAMWSGETEYSVGRCPWFGVPAIMQNQAQGNGEPVFATPNVVRQRKLHALCLCDICAKPLRDASKYSMSRFGHHPLPGETLRQSEPLICARCARLSMQRCPSLRKAQEDGTFRIRRVTKFRAEAAQATRADIEKYVPDHDVDRCGPIAGLGVVEIAGWKDVTGDFA